MKRNGRNDSKTVSVASNKFQSEPIQRATKWNKVLRKHTKAYMPNSVAVYNRYMGKHIHRYIYTYVCIESHNTIFKCAIGRYQTAFIAHKMTVFGVVQHALYRYLFIYIYIYI